MSCQSDALAVVNRRGARRYGACTKYRIDGDCVRAGRGVAQGVGYFDTVGEYRGGRSSV